MPPHFSHLLLADGKRSPRVNVLRGAHHRADPGFSFPRMTAVLIDTVTRPTNQSPLLGVGGQWDGHIYPGAARR